MELLEVGTIEQYGPGQGAQTVVASCKENAKNVKEMMLESGFMRFPDGSEE